MNSVTELKPNEPDRAAERERSKIEFPYTDLENAMELIHGVHNAGGTACEFEQLAAALHLEAKGGGFRLRVNGAKTFGLIAYERGGRISLTELGRQATDPHLERHARVSAFLSVPLYQRVYEEFKGGPLPPSAGLERTIGAMGVGSKVTDKARQVMLRSAKFAGFFDANPDRLVKPNIRQDATPERVEQGGSTGTVEEQVRSGGGNGGSGASGQSHPLIQGLLLTLPEPGSEWDAQGRVDWLRMAGSIFTMIYKGKAAQIRIELSEKSGGAASA